MRALTVVHFAFHWPLLLDEARMNRITGECDKVLTMRRTTGITMVPLHGFYVIIQLSDGGLCAGSMRGLICIWSTAAGHQGDREPIQQHHGHSKVICLIQLSNGNICSGSQDGVIFIWNVATGLCERALCGHKGPVRSLIQLSDGRLCSGAGSLDCIIRIWNSESGACETLLTGHASYVLSLIQLRDGRVCSGSGDNTVRMWPSSDIFKMLD
jgi:WD40 repeat protein